MAGQVPERGWLDIRVVERPRALIAKLLGGYGDRSSGGVGFLSQHPTVGRDLPRVEIGPGRGIVDDTRRRLQPLHTMALLVNRSIRLARNRPHLSATTHGIPRA